MPRISHRSLGAVGALAAVAVLAAGCGSSGGGSTSASQSTQGSSSSASAGGAYGSAPAGSGSSSTASSSSGGSSGPAVLKTTKGKLGTFLVDSKGISLYLFKKDKGTSSTCYGGCAQAWPPLLTSGKPTGQGMVKASLLGTTKRKDGKLEVTYNGHPLYYYVGDKSPGQTTGQDLRGFGAPWYVVNPAGEQIGK